MQARSATGTQSPVAHKPHRALEVVGMTSSVELVVQFCNATKNLKLLLQVTPTSRENLPHGKCSFVLASLTLTPSALRVTLAGSLVCHPLVSMLPLNPVKNLINHAWPLRHKHAL